MMFSFIFSMFLVVQSAGELKTDAFKFLGHSGLYRNIPGIQSSEAIVILIMMANDADSSTREDALWALSYICDSDSDSEQIQSASTPGLIEVLFANIDPALPRSRITPALRAIGNLTTGFSNVPTTMMINATFPRPKLRSRPRKNTGVNAKGGLLPLLANLASNMTLTIRRELLWCISNILAGGSDQTNDCIQAGIMDAIILIMLSPDISDNIAKEGLWCVINAFTAASDADFRALLFHEHLVKLLFYGLHINHNQATINAALNAMGRIIDYTKTLRNSCLRECFEDPFTSLFREIQLSLVENAALSNNSRAVSLLETLDEYCVENLVAVMEDAF